MKKTITYLLFILILFSCKEKMKPIKMTVIYHNSLNIDSTKWYKKYLIKDSLIDLKKAKIDLYFSKSIAKIPYYLPTNGIFKDSIKDKECDISIYPVNVKCYKYDNKNRVKRMSVNGSGTAGDWNYKYDQFDRIIEIEFSGTRYLIDYDKELNLLKEIVKEIDGNFKERIEILYK